eukprot:COSAG02_NODE_6379_length_3611_cov_2.560649_1_plen_150_part_00
MNPTRLLLRELRSGGRGGPGVGQTEESQKGNTEGGTSRGREQEEMCATTTKPLAVVDLPTSPAKGGVTIVRMSRGRRMSEEAFNRLPEKEKIRVLRNRRNALQTRARRQARIKNLTKENTLLEASVTLKEKQIAVLLSLLGGAVVKAER